MISLKNFPSKISCMLAAKLNISHSYLENCLIHEYYTKYLGRISEKYFEMSKQDNKLLNRIIFIILTKIE